VWGSFVNFEKYFFLLYLGVKMEVAVLVSPRPSAGRGDMILEVATEADLC